MWVSDTPPLPLGYYYDFFCPGEPEALIYLLPTPPEGRFTARSLARSPLSSETRNQAEPEWRRKP